MGDRPTRGGPPLILLPLRVAPSNGAPRLVLAPLRSPALWPAPLPPAPAWHRAHATLGDACRLLIGRVGAPAARAGSAAFRNEIALRWAGNALKELDRFLSVLLDACAPAAGMPAAQIEAFERSHDTARKLRRVERLLGRDGAETPQLQAIGRLRRMACAERDGTPHSDLAKDLAIATGGQLGMSAGELAAGAAAAAAMLGDETLAAIARIYRSIGDGLAAACAARGPALDFSSTIADINRANVACDGI